MKNICDLKENDKVNSVYLVGSVLKGKTTTGSDYLSLKLQDATGEIDAKLWQVSTENLNNIVNGTLLNIEGNVIKYRDNLQLKIEGVNIVSEQDVDIQRFVKKAPIAANELRNELQQFIYEIDDGIINTIVTELIKKYEDSLLSYPAAAKIHHAYQGGLLFHIVSMLRLGKSLIELYPVLNKNYLYAGIILHDLGKVEELTGAIATEYTLKGKLVGHISIICAKVQEIAKDINQENSEQAIILEHLILSHHGKLEYGSPVLPMTREAEILTFIDNIDARMDTLDKVFSGVEPGMFSARVFSLENRSFYLPKENNIKEEN